MTLLHFATFKNCLNVSLKFEPRDLWIGIYWHYSKSVESAYRRWQIYICILPLLPIKFDIETGWRK